LASKKAKNLRLCALLGQKNGMDVWEDTSSCNGYSTQQLVQFFIILDSQCNVAWDNTTLLVITGGIAGKFQNLGTEILEYSREVHWSTGTHPSCVFALAQVTSNTTNGELETSLGGSRCRLLFPTSTLSFSFARHDDVFTI
jgi:hypothetical protein